MTRGLEDGLGLGNQSGHALQLGSVHTLQAAVHFLQGLVGAEIEDRLALVLHDLPIRMEPDRHVLGSR